MVTSTVVVSTVAISTVAVRTTGTAGCPAAVRTMVIRRTGISHMFTNPQGIRRTGISHTGMRPVVALPGRSAPGDMPPMGTSPMGIRRTGANLQGRPLGTGHTLITPTPISHTGIVTATVSGRATPSLTVPSTAMSRVSAISGVTTRIGEGTDPGAGMVTEGTTDPGTASKPGRAATQTAPSPSPRRTRTPIAVPASRRCPGAWSGRCSPAMRRSACEV